MTLLRWYDDLYREDKDRHDEQPFHSSGAASSVQSSAWQPTDERGDDSPAESQPYITSDEKAGRDAIVNLKGQVDAQRNASQQAAPDESAGGSSEPEYYEEYVVEEPIIEQHVSNEASKRGRDIVRDDNGWRRYYDKALEREKRSMSFWDKLLDGGGASRRAEVSARNQYNNDLLSRAYENGRTVDPEAAIRARALSTYTGSFANANAQNAAARARAIGAYDDSNVSPVSAAVNALRQANLYDSIAGVNDTTRFTAGDIARFIGSLPQGLLTAPIIGSKSLYEAVSGRGTDYDTGRDKDLSAQERIGRAGSGVIDTAGLAFGGSGTLIKSIGAKIGSGTATNAEKSLFKQLVKDSGKEGAEESIQQVFDFAGDGKTLTDAGGRIDTDRLGQLAGDVAQAGLLGAAGGGVMSGAGRLVNSLPGFTPSRLPEVDTVQPASQRTSDEVRTEGDVITDSQSGAGGLVGGETVVGDAGATPYPPRASGVIASDTGAPVDNPVDNPASELTSGLTPGPAQVTAPPAGGHNPSPVPDGVVSTSSDVNAPRQATDVKNDIPGSTEADVSAYRQELQQMANGLPAINRDDVIDRVMSNESSTKEIKSAVADALGVPNLGDVSIRETVDSSELGSDKLKSSIVDKYEKLEDLQRQFNDLQSGYRKAVKNNQINSVSDEDTTQSSKLIGEIGRVSRDLAGDVRKLKGQTSFGDRIMNAVENLLSYRKANMLTGMPMLERNLLQDAMGTLKTAIENPVAFLRGMRGNGNVFKSSIKSAVMDWAVLPKTLSEVPGYFVGNIYRSMMSPVTAVADMRRGMMRETIAERLLMLIGEKDITPEKVKRFSHMLGSDSEVMVHTMAGVANGMSSRRQADQAWRSYLEFAETGSADAHNLFSQKVSRQANLARSLTSSLRENGGVNNRVVAALIDWALPMVSTPANLLSTTFTDTLNPASMSVVDNIMKDVRSAPHNIGNIIKHKAGDYGIIGAAVALMAAGSVGYNDGDDNEKPRGIWVKISDTYYMPIRAFAFETPVAIALTVAQLTKDVAEGTATSPKKYYNMISGSMPYLDSFGGLYEASQSLINGETEGGDKLYAAKQYGVSSVRSLVPLSSNGLLPWASRFSVDPPPTQKQIYDKDIGKWIANSLARSYITREQYDRLPDKRDAMGRLSAVDNQGAFVNKRLTERKSVEYNDVLNSMLSYGKQNGLGGNARDMFGTHGPDGHNFKSARDAIIFSDVPSGQKLDKSTMLDQSGKLYGLARQIHDGFYGVSGDELLKVGDKSLMSDVSMPNAAGSKNTTKPLSMQSIVNAIAQTDMSPESRERLSALSSRRSQLYSQYKAGSIDRETYTAEASQTRAEERSLLMGSASYARLDGLMGHLRSRGFFDEGGLGSTKTGQLYLWNAFNKILGQKGKTPAADYKEDDRYTPYRGGGYSRRFGARRRGRGGRRGGGGVDKLPASYKPGQHTQTGVTWGAVTPRSMSRVDSQGLTPFRASVSIGGGAVGRDKTQYYGNRSF